MWFSSHNKAIAYLIAGGKYFYSFGPVSKFQSIMSLLIATGCWSDCAYKLLIYNNNKRRINNMQFW